MLTFFCDGISATDVGMHCTCGRSYLIESMIPPRSSGRLPGTCPNCHEAWIGDRARLAAALALLRLGAAREDVAQVLGPKVPRRRGVHAVPSDSRQRLAEKQTQDP